jgi:hypothetical protein
MTRKRQENVKSSVKHWEVQKVKCFILRDNVIAYLGEVSEDEARGCIRSDVPLPVIHLCIHLWSLNTIRWMTIHSKRRTDTASEEKKCPKRRKEDFREAIRVCFSGGHSTPQ